MNLHLPPRAIGPITALAFLCGAPPGHAALIFSFSVSLATSPLIGEPSGPFSLDFQLNDGSGTGDGNNSATLTNFTFGAGGMAGPGAPTLIGGAAGDLSTAIMLRDLGFQNEFFQEFTPGDLLCFDVSLTTNVDPGPTPDQFSFAILDGTGAEIPTQAIGGEVFLRVNITADPPPIETFASDLARTSIDLGSPSVGPCIPEPGAMMLSAVALLGFLGTARTRREAVTAEYIEGRNG